jgi:protein-arginine kinase activator protein McsA
MKCQRCLRNEARYRVYTDVIDMKVCVACAEEARGLRIPVEVLDSSERMKQCQVLCTQKKSGFR